jgi:hypothetical protein
MISRGNKTKLKKIAKILNKKRPESSISMINTKRSLKS